MNPSAKKGVRNEHKVIKLLEASGYLCTRSAGSLGIFDLIAVNRNEIRFIQVKTNRWPGTVEREDMAAAKINMPPNATVECWRWNDYARSPLIKHIEEF